MLGIPFLIGNFLPDSGQTSDPSSTSTCIQKKKHIKDCWLNNNVSEWMAKYLAQGYNIKQISHPLKL